MLTVLISAGILTFVAVFVSLFFVRRGRSKAKLLRLVGFSSGSFLGSVFFHLLPEMAEKGIPQDYLFFSLITILLYFLAERLLFSGHHHGEKRGEDHGHLGYLNIFGDGVHNFLDGLIIASAYAVDFNLGVIVTISVALHEIPQEVGDFGVLLYAGFPFKKALTLNFLAAGSVVLGALTGQVLLSYVGFFQSYFLPIAIGGFLYIAMSTMFPILHEEGDKKEFLYNFGFLLLGAALVYLFKSFS